MLAGLAGSLPPSGLLELFGCQRSTLGQESSENDFNNMTASSI